MKKTRGSVRLLDGAAPALISLEGRRSAHGRVSNSRLIQDITLLEWIWLWVRDEALQNVWNVLLRRARDQSSSPSPREVESLQAWVCLFNATFSDFDCVIDTFSYACDGQFSRGRKKCWFQWLSSARGRWHFEYNYEISYSNCREAFELVQSLHDLELPLSVF